MAQQQSLHDKEKDFKAVPKDWLKKRLSIDDAILQMAQSQQVIEDIVCPLQDFKPCIENDRYGWEYIPTGRVYFPTPKALSDMAVLNGGSTWAVQALAGNQIGEKFTRDRRDSEALKTYIDVHLFQPDRFNVEKDRLFRTWNDGTLRACLSTKYIVINNVWVLEQIKRVIPGGLLSHWRSNPDELWGNVLIPDTIRVVDDSDYGGLLSVGNSEIGTGRLYSQPSVFRSICMNGCIYDKQSGQAISKVHLGRNFDLDALSTLIFNNLNKQIPLLDSGIDKLLALKQYEAKDVNHLQLLGQLAIDFRFNAKQLNEVTKAYIKEEETIGEMVKTGFGLATSITRAGQQLSNQEWVLFDEYGGSFLEMTKDRWDKFVNSANKLGNKELQKLGLAI
jgi:hypothetical protein